MTRFSSASLPNNHVHPITLRMTRLGEALAEELTRLNKPVVSSYEMFRSLWHLHVAGEVKYLRNERPSKELFHRTRSLLYKEGVIRKDNDYPRLWRVMAISDASADEIVCAADPDCYLSHLSAMQRYGLSNRRPEALFITMPPADRIKARLKKQLRADYGDAIGNPEWYIERPFGLRHPRRVRGRVIDPITTRFYGEWRQVRGEWARIGTIGQTFLNMLEEPDRCGGMLHILSVWEEHAKT